MNTVPKEILELMKEHIGDFIDTNPMAEVEMSLSQEQREAYDAFKRGRNVLFIGEAGTGKSHLIRACQEYIRNTTKKTMVLTSTTGISAYNIGGITINAFMGIGTGDAPVDRLLSRVRRNKQAVARLRDVDVLVIDEISMMSAALFEKVHAVLASVRRSNALFGGVQLVLSGDFMQLLPVFSGPISNGDKEEDKRLLVECPLFVSSFTKHNTVSLSKNMRQSDDTRYAQLLSRLRMGVHTAVDIATLLERMGVAQGQVVRLVSSNWKAGHINSAELDKLRTEHREYTVEWKSKSASDYLKQELHQQLRQRGMDVLRLKVNARVMLVKNIDVEAGLVNGATGTVESFTFEGYPVVAFDGNTGTHVIPNIEWELEDSQSKVVARQVPLMLAWALTVHKSQSLTFERCELDIGDSFCDHHVYVALSRVKSLDGLYLKSFDPARVTVNEKSAAFTVEFTKSKKCRV